MNAGIITHSASLCLGHQASDRFPSGTVKKQSLTLEGRGDDEFVPVEFVAKYMCSYSWASDSGDRRKMEAQNEQLRTRLRLRQQ